MTSKKDRELREKRKQQEKKNQQTRTIIIVGIVLILIAAYIGLRQIPANKYNLNELDMPAAIASTKVNGATIGDDTAPVKIQEFSSYSCSHCRNFALDEEDYFLQEYVENGLVQIEFVPVSFFDESLMLVEKGNYCALDQGQFYEYRNLAFANQFNDSFYPYTENTVMAYAHGLGLDMNEFRTCFNSDKYDEKILENYQYITALEVTQTPTFIINGDAENRVIGASAYTLNEAILNYLQP